MKGRIAMLIGVAWLVFAFFRLFPKPEVTPAPTDYVAARALEPGEQLASADLEAAEAGAKGVAGGVAPKRIEGKFVREPVSKGQPVTEQNIVDHPELNAAPGTVVYWIPLKPRMEIKPHLSAKRVLTLCWADDPCVHDSTVLAVTCPAADTCFAATQIPRDRAAEAGPAEELRVFLQ